MSAKTFWLFPVSFFAIVIGANVLAEQQEGTGNLRPAYFAGSWYPGEKA